MHACAILLIKRLPLSDCDTPTRLQSSANGPANSLAVSSPRSNLAKAPASPELPMTWLIVVGLQCKLALKLRDGCKWRVENDSTEVEEHASCVIARGRARAGVAAPWTSSLVVVIEAHHSRSYPYRTGQQNKHTQTGRGRFRSHLRAINTDTPQHKDSRAKERSGNKARRRGVHGGRGDDGRGSIYAREHSLYGMSSLYYIRAPRGENVHGTDSRRAGRIRCISRSASA